MRVIVTRPVAQAGQWVDDLRCQGFDAVALPLMAVAAADPAPVQAAWQRLPQQALVVFVSPSAVAQFFALGPPALAWPHGVQAAAPGPGTAQALRRCGVPADCVIEPAADAAQFDSESLFEQLKQQQWAGRHVLFVRGDGGREWLADTLRAAGARITTVAAYRRVPPRWSAAENALALDAAAAPVRHCWLFSSAQAIGHLMAALPEATWHAARAVASHHRIAERARGAGFGRVDVCRPALPAVVACLQSLPS